MVVNLKGYMSAVDTLKCHACGGKGRVPVHPAPDHVLLDDFKDKKPEMWTCTGCNGTGVTKDLSARRSFAVFCITNLMR